MTLRSTSLALLACVALPTSFADAQSSETGFAAAGDVPTMAVIPLAEALERAFRPLYATRPDGPRLTALEGDPSTGLTVSTIRG